MYYVEYNIIILLAVLSKRSQQQDEDLHSYQINDVNIDHKIAETTSQCVATSKTTLQPHPQMVANQLAHSRAALLSVCPSD